MKVRITNDAARIRISKTEVDELKQNKSVGLKTIFPGSEAFSCELVPGSNQTITIAMLSNKLTINVPQSEILSWATSGPVQMEETIYFDNGKEFLILVEKDFKRLSNRTREDESDLFSNPKDKVK